jgi:2'-5' RNA ligase
MQIYEQLWGEAVAALALGRPQVDPHLSDRAHDWRRGVSLLFQPSPGVQARIKLLLDELAAEFPGQYFYRPEELHVTVLSLISASEDWRNQIREVSRFKVLLREALRGQPNFEISFRGVTAAPNAVMIQGFPVGEALEKLRGTVRRAFAQHGFGDRLDRRYRNVTAHLTAMRFARPDANWQRLLAILTAHRETRFGNGRVSSLQLVWGDWYRSTGNLRILEEFRLENGD